MLLQPLTYSSRVVICPGNINNDSFWLALNSSNSLCGIPAAERHTRRDD